MELLLIPAPSTEPSSVEIQNSSSAGLQSKSGNERLLLDESGVPMVPNTPESSNDKKPQADSKTFSVPKKSSKSRIPDSEKKENRSSMGLRKRKLTTEPQDDACSSQKRRSARNAAKDKHSDESS